MDKNLSPLQSYSTLAFDIPGGIILYIRGRLAASLASTHWMLVASPRTCHRLFTMTIKNASRHFQMSPEGQNHPWWRTTILVLSIQLFFHKYQIFLMSLKLLLTATLPSCCGKVYLSLNTCSSSISASFQKKGLTRGKVINLMTTQQEAYSLLQSLLSWKEIGPPFCSAPGSRHIPQLHSM